MFLEGKKPHFAVIAGCIFYGMNGLFIDRIHGMSIAPIIFYRLFFGLLFLFIYSCQRKNLGPEIKEKKGEPSSSRSACSRMHVALFYLPENYLRLYCYPAPVHGSLLRNACLSSYPE